MLAINFPSLSVTRGHIQTVIKWPHSCYIIFHYITTIINKLLYVTKNLLVIVVNVVKKNLKEFSIYTSSKIFN